MDVRENVELRAPICLSHTYGTQTAARDTHLSADGQKQPAGSGKWLGDKLPCEHECLNPGTCIEAKCRSVHLKPSPGREEMYGSWSSWVSLVS